jgi:hypothetical protein
MLLYFIKETWSLIEGMLSSILHVIQELNSSYEPKDSVFNDLPDYGCSLEACRATSIGTTANQLPSESSPPRKQELCLATNLSLLAS